MALTCLALRGDSENTTALLEHTLRCLLGPALGGLRGGVHLRAPFLAAAGLNLVNVIYGLFVLPESLRPELRRPFSLRRANSFASLKSLTRWRARSSREGWFAS